MSKFKDEFGSDVWVEVKNKIGFMNGDKFSWWLKRRPIQVLRTFKRLLLDKKVKLVIGYKSGLKETYKFKIKYHLYKNVVKNIQNLTDDSRFKALSKDFIHLNLFLGCFETREIYKDIFVKIEDVSFMRFK